jgi:protein phosphatase 2C
MEDAFAVALSFLASDPSSPGATDGGEQEHDFFAVYDGHGGARVAEACRERMHVVLAEEVGLRRGVGSDLRWEEAMAACFARVDGEVTGGFAPPPKPPPQAAADDDAGAGDLPYRTVGSTAVVAVVGQRRIVVANCGDSRAVLSRGGVAVPLSTDHKVTYYVARTGALLMHKLTRLVMLPNVYQRLIPRIYCLNREMICA